MGKRRLLFGMTFWESVWVNLAQGKKLLLELLIVFVGVYAAFLLSNYSEEQKTQVQKQKIMISLKSELEYMRAFYPSQQVYQAKMVKEWRMKLDSNLIADFYNWRYVQPQHNYMVVEYAINSREIGVIDFNLHQKLLTVYQGLKQVEYAEEKMTNLALEYQPIPAQMDSTQQTYQLLFRRNRFIFRKFTTFAGDRASILGRIANAAQDALKLINENFSAQELRKIEKEMMMDTFKKISEELTEEDIKEYVITMFPQMSAKDLKSIIAEVKKVRAIKK